LQKSAPVSAEHCVLQPPVTVVEHIADPISWQLMSQLKFACAWQLPWHESWHWVMHETDGDVPMQPTLQWAPHVCWHDAVHCDWFMSELHWAWQCPLQSASQLPEQLNDPGLPMQLVMHEPSQVLVQLASMEPMHVPPQLASSCAEQLASTFTGVQLAVQPPDVSNWQLLVPDVSMSMSPQADR
jgi:hypothetical protein